MAPPGLRATDSTHPNSARRLEPPFAHSGAHLCFGGLHYTPWVGEGPKKMGVVPPAALSTRPKLRMGVMPPALSTHPKGWGRSCWGRSWLGSQRLGSQLHSRRA